MAADALPASTKPIHTILLDSSPLLLNTPSISTLLANSHVLVTTPLVLAEIKNEEARFRIDTLYMPFMKVLSPKPESVKFVKEFARKTGDAAVLSSTDFEVLGLAYDLEIERNGGDWRLRSKPGARVNGSPPKRMEQTEKDKETSNVTPEDAGSHAIAKDMNDIESQLCDVKLNTTLDTTEMSPDPHHTSDLEEDKEERIELISEISDASSTRITEEKAEDEESAESDQGWITPSNIKKHQAKDEAPASISKNETKVLQVATITGDFAVQNVLLQINLNLLSTKTCQRITQIKQFILRCHGCFNVTKDMSKQFCPRCGKPTLTRVNCTTSASGEVKIHLKANMQWNNKGNVYSIPKPMGGTANQKWKGPSQGGGQRGWGNDLILAEDQKEYVRAMSTMKRTKNKDLMDEDTLPNILSGDRDRSGGRVRVGAGRGVNSRKR